MPTAGFIQLPDDSANAGKKRRTQTRTVGADTVHEEFAILQDPTNDDQARVLTSAPAGTEGGLVTRNIPGGTQAVSGTITANAGTGTFAVSAAALPLPAGASTSAKQPALGTAGTASADVITVQGIASMTAMKVDGSGVTQPVSGPLTDTQLRATAVPMSLASLPSLAAGTNAIGKLAANAGVTVGAVEIAAAQTLAVTNAGTFAVQAAQAGTWNIGTLTTLTGITNVVHVDDNAGSLTVDGTVTANQGGTWNVGSIAGTITPGTGATNLGKAEDAAHTSGDVGILNLTVRDDALANLAGTTGDYQAMISDAQGSTRVVAGGYNVVKAATLTRPADTTAYVTGDEMSSSTTAPAVLTIAGCARYNGGSGMITSLTVIDSANAATDPVLELWLFDTTSTPNNDNAAFAPSDAVAQTCIAVIALGTGFAGDSATTGNIVWNLRNLFIPFVCGAASTSLFVRFVLRGGYTPASAETFTVRLGITQD